MSWHYWDVLRLVNVGLLLVGLGYMIKLYAQRTNLADMPLPVREQIQLTQLAIAGVLFAVIFGTVESLLKGIPGGPRVAILTAPSLMLVVAVFWPRILPLLVALQRRRHQRRRVG
jgi:hypothetical protein